MASVKFLARSGRHRVSVDQWKVVRFRCYNHDHSCYQNSTRYSSDHWFCGIAAGRGHVNKNTSIVCCNPIIQSEEIKYLVGLQQFMSGLIHSTYISIMNPKIDAR